MQHISVLQMHANYFATTRFFTLCRGMRQAQQQYDNTNICVLLVVRCCCCSCRDSTHLLYVIVSLSVAVVACNNVFVVVAAFGLACNEFLHFHATNSIWQTANRQFSISNQVACVCMRSRKKGKNTTATLIYY